jgi:hypothetical protein
MPKAPRAETHVEETPAPREAMTISSSDVGRLEDVVGLAVAVTEPPPASPAPPVPPDAPTPAAAAPSTRTPEEWARIKGLFLPAATSYKIAHFDWKHAAAEAAHGWADHAHHAGAPMQLSEADYDAAIAAVQTSAMTPHAPAVSPHSPHRQGA